jgi:hypothetical protein
MLKLSSFKEVIFSSLLKGVFPSSIKGIPSRANNYGR